MALEFLGPEVVKLASALPEIQTYLKICEEKGVAIQECTVPGIGGGFGVSYAEKTPIISITVNEGIQPLDYLATFVHEFIHYKNAVGRLFPWSDIDNFTMFYKRSIWDEVEAYTAEAEFVKKYWNKYSSYNKNLVVHLVKGTIDEHVNSVVFGDGKTYHSYTKERFDTFRYYRTVTKWMIN
jgi:hypothetical protein